MNRGRQTCFLSETRPFENSHLEIHAFRVAFEVQPRMFHECREWYPTRHWRPVTGVVDQKDRARLRHEIDGGDEDDEKRRAEDLDDIEVQ